MPSPSRRGHVQRSLVMPTEFKRCKRFNEIGHAHELTFSCFRRQPFLAGERARVWLADAIDLARERHSFHVWAYVVMPEHAHFLIWPTGESYNISKTLATIRLPVVRRAVAHVRKYAPSFLSRMRDAQPNGKVHYRFWQRGGGYDRNSFEPTTIWKQIEYIHFNPVRRGLCEKAEQWFYSSAGDYAGLRQGPISIDFSSLPRTIEG
jgi:putative transposase